MWRCRSWRRAFFRNWAVWRWWASKILTIGTFASKKAKIGIISSKNSRPNHVNSIFEFLFSLHFQALTKEMQLHWHQTKGRLSVTSGRSDQFTKFLRSNVDFGTIQLLEDTRKSIDPLCRLYSNFFSLFLQPLNLMTFSNDSKVRNFINKFISNESVLKIYANEEMETIQIFTLQFYHCLVKDTMHALGTFIDLMMVSAHRMLSWLIYCNFCLFLQSLQRIKASKPSSYEIWQLKLIQSSLQRNRIETLLSSELLNSLIQQSQYYFDNQLISHKMVLRNFFASVNIDFFKEISERDHLRTIAAVISFFRLPSSIFSSSSHFPADEMKSNPLRLMLELKRAGFNTESVHAIKRIFEDNVQWIFKIVYNSFFQFLIENQ